MRLLLQNPQFRRLLIGGAVNDLGLTLYMMVHGWLALDVTDSPFWVGATIGTGGIGMMGFAVFGGVLVDRVDRRKLIISVQMVQASIAFALVYLIFTDQTALWHLLAFALIQGAAISVKVPTRMALAMDVAGRENLLSAIAAGFASMTLMGIGAPILGGVVVSAFSIGWAYVIIGCAYLLSAVVFANLAKPVMIQRSATSPRQDFKEGIRYVTTTPIIRSIILIVLIVEGFGWSHESMLPVMARDVLVVGASGLGFLFAAGSGGGAVSTVVVSNMGNVKEKGRLLILGAGGFGFFLVLFGISPWFPLSMALLALAYAAVVAYEATASTLLQTLVPNEMRGRVLSFQTFAWGLTALSGFHTGAIASAVGAPVAIAIGGGIVLLFSLRLLPSASRYREQPVELASGD
jgi:MFS family permease